MDLDQIKSDLETDGYCIIPDILSEEQVQEYLPLAYKDGSHLEARAQMLVASTMGATSFQKGLGAMHSMSHPCSAVLNTNLLFL